MITKIQKIQIHPFEYIICIAQIGPLSFQAAIEHKPKQVRWGGLHARVVTEWWPACLHKHFSSVHHRGNQRKPLMEDVHNLINFGPLN